jgi:hypothetical protein
VPDLCLTDGHVRDGRYGPGRGRATTVFRRDTADDDARTSRFRRVPHRVAPPAVRKGCLKVLEDGLLEPWDDCAKATPFAWNAPRTSTRCASKCVGIAGTGDSAEALDVSGAVSGSRSAPVSGGRVRPRS